MPLNQLICGKNITERLSINLLQKYLVFVPLSTRIDHYYVDLSFWCLPENRQKRCNRQKREKKTNIVKTQFDGLGRCVFGCTNPVISISFVRCMKYCCADSYKPKKKHEEEESFKSSAMHFIDYILHSHRSIMDCGVVGKRVVHITAAIIITLTVLISHGMNGGMHKRQSP